jgi:predicted nucleic acid-binding protein
MTIVLDVSAAIQIVLQKEKKDLFESLVAKASWVIAPELYISEITNVLWKYYKNKILTHDECLQYLEDGLALIDDFFTEKDMWKEVLGESIKNDHSAYAMFYAVLARRNDSILVSNDKELIKIAEEMKIEHFG